MNLLKMLLLSGLASGRVFGKNIGAVGVKDLQTDLTKIDVQIVEKTLSRLKSRQGILECQRADGDGSSSPTENLNFDGIEVDKSYVVPVYDPPNRILHVKSASNIDEHFQYGIKSKSEIILRCASLRPMENLDDPVHKIDCFRTSASTPN